MLNFSIAPILICVYNNNTINVELSPLRKFLCLRYLQILSLHSFFVFFVFLIFKQLENKLCIHTWQNLLIAQQSWQLATVNIEMCKGLKFYESVKN